MGGTERKKSGAAAHNGGIVLDGRHPLKRRYLRGSPALAYVRARAWLFATRASNANLRRRRHLYLPRALLARVKVARRCLDERRRNALLYSLLYGDRHDPLSRLLSRLAIIIRDDRFVIDTPRVCVRVRARVCNSDYRFGTGAVCRRFIARHRDKQRRSSLIKTSLAARVSLSARRILLMNFCDIGR